MRHLNWDYDPDALDQFLSTVPPVPQACIDIRCALCGTPILEGYGSVRAWWLSSAPGAHVWCSEDCVHEWLSDHADRVMQWLGLQAITLTGSGDGVGREVAHDQD